MPQARLGSTTAPAARFRRRTERPRLLLVLGMQNDRLLRSSRDKAEDEFQDGAGRMPALPIIGSAKLLIQATIVLDKGRISMVILSWPRF